ncbi:MAG: J domain-containing protein [Candidatus Dormibacteria bacterium]
MRFPDGVASDDLYALLGLSPFADPAAIEQAWRAEVQRWHPDRNPDPLSTSRTAFINVAYSILRDPVQKVRYDEAGLMGPVARPPERHRRRQTPTPSESRWRAFQESWAAEEERAQRFRAYFQLESKMRASYDANPRTAPRLRGALAAALAAVPLLPQLLRDVLRDATDFGSPAWLPAPWPPVTIGLELAVMVGDAGALGRIVGVLNQNEELGSWRYLIEPARQSMRDAEAILGYVREHPGTLQSRLGRELSQDQQRVTAPLCTALVAAGRLQRRRALRSYALLAP